MKSVLRVALITALLAPLARSGGPTAPTSNPATSTAPAAHAPLPAQGSLKGKLTLGRNTFTDDDEVKADLVLSSGEELSRRLLFTLTRNGETIHQELRNVTITATPTAHAYTWKTGEAPGGTYQLTATVYRKDALSPETFTGTFEKISRKDVERIVEEFQKDAKTLSKLLDNCRQRDIPAPYETAALTLARHFAPWIRNDLTIRERPYNPAPDGVPLSEPQKVTGPLKGLFWTRARANAEYVRHQVRSALERAGELLEHPTHTMAIPPLDRASLTAQGGIFRDKNGPVILLGAQFGENGKTRDELKVLADYGFNWWGIPCGGAVDDFRRSPAEWDRIKPLPDWPAEFFGCTLGQAYARATELNLAIHSWFSWWNVPPAVTGEQHAPGCRSGFLFDIEDPKQTQAFSKYLRYLAQHTGAFPAHLDFGLYNDVRYLPCTCNRGERRFRAAMEQKYHTIRKLNEAWGTTYGTFEEVTVPRDRTSGPGPWYDYHVMHRKELPRRIDWMAREVRAVSPRSRLSVQILAGAGSDDFCRSGIDHEALGEVTDLYAFGARIGCGPSGPLAFDPWQELGIDDLHRSLKPQAPMLETEFRVVPPDTWGKVNPDHIKACFWSAAVHGVDGFLPWAWQRPGYNGSTGNPLDEHADRTHAVSTAALDLRRLAKYITAIPAQKSEVAILFSAASQIHAGNLSQSLMDVYRGLFWLNTPPTDFVTERQIAAGKLAGYRLLVIHDTPYLPADTLNRIATYVRNGGNLVITLNSARWDPYGRPLHASDLVGGKRHGPKSPFSPAPIKVLANDIFKAKSPALKPQSRQLIFDPGATLTLALHDGVPVITLNHFGKGLVYYLGTDLTMESWTAFFDRVLFSLGIKRGGLALADKAGQPLVGVEHREAAVDGSRIIYLMNMTPHSVDVCLPAGGKKPPFDLIANKPLSKMSLSLKPLVPHLLRID